jgi:hypothetical protein
MVSIDVAVFSASTYKEVIQGKKGQSKWHENEEDQKVLAWLSHLSFEETHQDILSKRHPGTAGWLFVFART